MSTQRKLSIYASLFGVLFLAGTGSAKETIEPLSNQCVEPAAQQRLEACPGGPGFDIRTKRSAAFKTAPQPRQKKKRVKEVAPVDPSSTLPTSMRNVRRNRLESRAYKLLLTEITSLERLFKRTPKRSPDRVKLARRLAEAYVELEAASNKGRLKAQITGQDLKGNKAKVKQYRAARAQEKKWGKIVKASRKKAIAFYTLLKDNYPNYKQLDEVLYYLAFEYEQAGDINNARQIYYELIQSAPQSAYIPNAYLAFGELFFLEANADPGMWDLAEQSYREVTKYPAPKNKVYGYARYKLAYVYWNQGRYAKALNEFKKVVEFGNQFPELPNAKYLAKSAVRDIIPVYAISGRASRAYGFFKKVSGDKGGENTKTIDMLNELGLAYLDTGGYDEAVVLYHDLMARDKGDRFCMYQTQVTNAIAATKSANKAAIRKELDRQLGVLKTFVKGDHSAKSQAQCANDTAALLTETAMAWHLEAVGTGKQRGTNNQKTMDLAALLYKKVTDTFTSADFENFKFPRIAKEDWPNLYKVRYSMADLLYAQKRWESCGPAFDSVVAENPKGQMAAEAAYAAVLCYQNYYDQQHQGKSQYASNNTLKDKGKKKKVSAWDKLKPQELDGMKKGMLTAFSRYICYIKPPAQVKSAEDKKAYSQYVDVKFARARTYYEAYHWEEAGLAFRDIALNHADHDSGLYAAHLYLDSMNVLGGIAEPPRPECYDGMNGDVPRFISLFCGGEIAEDNEEQCTLLTSLQCQIMGKKAEATVAKADGFNKSGDIPSALATYKLGGEAYIDIWKKYGSEQLANGQKSECPDMDKVLYNAAKAYQAGRLLASSIKVRKVLLNEKYGLNKSKLALKALYELGGNYQVITDFDQAANYYELYAKQTKYKGEFANIALSDAVALRLGLGQVEDALDLAKQYRKLKRTKANREKEAQIAFAVASHYAEEGDWKKVVQKLRSQMKTIDRQAAPDVKIRAHALLARAYAKLKKKKDAGREYGKVLKAYSDPEKVNEEIGIGRRLGLVLEAVGEALFFEAEKVRAKADSIKFPIYKSKGKSKLKGWKKEQEETKKVLEHINTKVADWMKKKQAAIQEADAAYIKIIALKPDAPPAWVIAAGERVGGMWAEFVLEFRAAPYPKAWDKKDMVEVKEAYFEALDRASEPMKLKGRGAFVTCLNRSVQYQYFDDNSRTCEVWLAKNYKHDFHLVDEFRGSPNRVNSTLQERPYPLTIGGNPFIPAPAEKAADTKTKAPAKKTDSKEKAANEGAQTRSQG